MFVNYPATVLTTTKRVRFSDDTRIKVFETEKKDNLSLIFYLTRNLINIQYVACTQIAKIITRFSGQYLIALVNPEDMPVKISTPGEIWYSDNGAIELLKLLNVSKYILRAFIIEFNIQAKNLLQNKSGSIKYQSQMKNFIIEIFGVVPRARIIAVKRP